MKDEACESNNELVVLSGDEIAVGRVIVSACGSLCLCCSKRECDSKLVSVTAFNTYLSLRE
jgi:hypothetical protein